MFFWILGCSSDDQTDLPENKQETEIEIGYVQTNKGSYAFDEVVHLHAFAIKNTSETKVSISKVIARIKKVNEVNFLQEIVLSDPLEIEVGKEHQIGGSELMTIPASFDEAAYEIIIKIVFSDTSSREFYKSFFRLVSDETNTTYHIARDDYQTLPIFKLKNGLSAEYAVQKSAAAFVSGISHSWETPLQPILSTPDFLERSINKTVDFYSELIGNSTEVETVIIAPGIPGIPYLAKSMNALVLPLHYLVGAGTVKEARGILDHANANGYSAYGTLGYDYSISTTTGVAWIKLLDLPKQYKQFILDHQVKNVVLCGHTGINDGETVARKVSDELQKYEKGSLYLMHFSGSASEGYLKQVIRDFNSTPLEPKEKIADWEAGITTEQLDAFSNSLLNETNVSVTSVTANDGVHLWNMGTYSSLALIHKNKAIFEDDGPAVRGVSLNPYLIAHPSYESWIRFVPFLYWQGFSAEYQYNNSLNTKIKSAINAYFPEIVFENLDFWVNSTNNFGGFNHGVEMVNFLKSKGLSVRNNDLSANEVWNISDGMNAPVEIRSENLLNDVSPLGYLNWNARLNYLKPEDLKDISNRFPEIKVTLK